MISSLNHCLGEKVGRSPTFLCIHCSKIWSFRKKFVSLQRSGEKSTLAEEALCTKLASENLGNFHAGNVNKECRTAST